jgi:hypothetical protein
MPPEAARELPPGGTLEEMTRAHLEFFPEIVTQSKTALVTWCAALALTGLGIALMTSGRRLWIPGLAVLLAAFSLTAPPRSMIVTAPADAVETQIYPASETVEVIRENLNGGRLLCLDSVYHFLYSRQHLELYPNRPLMRGIPDVRGYDPMIPAAHTRVMNAVAGLNLDTPAHGRLAMPQPIRWELLRMLNVTVVASLRPVEDDALALLWQGPNGMHLYRVREPGAPGRFASGFAVATGDPAIDLAVVAGGALDQFDPTHQVLLESETISLRGMMDMVASGSVTLIERGFDHLTYEVTAKSEGHLVTDVTFDPGWRAEVNGLPADTLIGDTRFLTVWVPQGTSRVEFTCWPKSLRHGALLTLAGVLLAALLCLPRRRSEEIGREKESPGA